MEAHSHGFDPRVKEENAEVKHKGGKLKCLTSRGWTDEKHMDYLSSIEQSFVDELNNKYCEEFLDWSHQKTKSTRNSIDGPLFHGQFKMLQEGGLKVIKYGSSGKGKKSDEGRKSRDVLLSDPWIQRWMSPCRGNNAGLIARDHRLDEPELGLSEVSDQNFWNEEIGVVESNRTYSKKRSRSATGCD
ncbi:cold regulated protein 27 [Rhynchospora pubera]|uniref:Cold regulated protein 27 n=1 Tax=Rhynchospora pubera TaxID=906938 RepID=A0AAV8FWZ3_9POAL|nr:cold regulated protein 27 [Rhynchospora pubera]